MNVDGEKGASETPKPEVETKEQTEAEATPRKIVLSNGQELTLKPTDMAVVVMFDTVSGQPAVFDIQNTPHRAYSMMILNEALRLYDLSSYVNSVAKVFGAIVAEASKKKPGLQLPTILGGPKKD